ncbi:hypothetical protein COOONC_17180 [Cooperia oncophora]
MPSIRKTKRLEQHSFEVISAITSKNDTKRGMWLVVLLTAVELRQALELRIDCHPEPRANMHKCRERDCIWAPTEEKTVPWCRMKEGIGYSHKQTDGSVSARSFCLLLTT